MSYRLPPLNGLRAFEAAGRHLSFKLAAQELSVTPGAVSQQFKHLEQVLGVPLFQRIHRSLVLTGHGEVLLPTVSEAFERMSTAIDKVARSLPGRTLRLGVSPDLAADPDRLLASLAKTGRAPDYIKAISTDDVADLFSGALDALLRPGPGPYPGMHAEVLDLHRLFSPHSRASLVVWPAGQVPGVPEGEIAPEFAVIVVESASPDAGIRSRAWRRRRRPASRVGGRSSDSRLSGRRAPGHLRASRGARDLPHALPFMP